MGNDGMVGEAAAAKLSDNYDRLAAVKAEYDPDNVFHLHHNVKPRTKTAA